jgi:uracil-DNA glycosylase family 4
MNGFFTHKQTQSKERPDGRTLTCTTCGLYQYCKTPRMSPYGDFKKKILNIGEAPGDVEDAKGRPWQGKTGKLLYRMYKSVGIDLFEDCLNVNAVNCHPTDKQGRNRAPTNDEIAACRRIVLRVIDRYKPHVIVLLGNSAIQSIIGHRWTRELGGITKWRGWTIPDRDLKAWVCPTFHPSYVSRADADEVDAVWMQDLKRIVSKIDEPLPEYREPQIDVVDEPGKMTSMSTIISIDFETTGIKPQAAGHRIVSCAIADSVDHAWAFLMPLKRSKQMPLLSVLRDKSIGKMAHNCKFEQTWATVRLRQPIAKIAWDSMLAAHVLDNRPGITSLDFQVYVNLGIIDYSS